MRFKSSAHKKSNERKNPYKGTFSKMEKLRSGMNPNLSQVFRQCFVFSAPFQGFLEAKLASRLFLSDLALFYYMGPRPKLCRKTVF